MEKRFGGRPTVTYFNTFVVVNNVIGEIAVAK